MKLFSFVLLLNAIVIIKYTVESLEFKSHLNKELSLIKENDPLKEFPRKEEFFKIYSEYEEALSASQFPQFEEISYLSQFPFLKDYTEEFKSSKDTSLLLTKTNILASSINDEGSIMFKDKLILLNKVKAIRDKIIKHNEGSRRIDRASTRLKEIKSQFEAFKNKKYESNFKALNGKVNSFETVIFVLFGFNLIFFITYAYGRRLSNRRKTFQFASFEKAVTRFREMSNSEYQFLMWTEISSFVPLDKKEEFLSLIEKREEFEMKLANLLLIVRPLDDQYYGIRKIDLELENKIKSQVQKDANDELAAMIDHLNLRIKLDLSKMKNLDAKYFFNIQQTVKDLDQKVVQQDRDMKKLHLDLNEAQNSIRHHQADNGVLKEKIQELEKMIHETYLTIQKEQKRYISLKETKNKELQSWKRYMEELQDHLQKIRQQIRELRVEDYQIVYQKINAVCLSFLAGQTRMELVNELSTLSKNLAESLGTENLNSVITKIDSARNGRPKFLEEIVQ